MHSDNRIGTVWTGVMFVLAVFHAALPAVAQEQPPATEGKLEVGPTWKFKTDPDNVGVKDWFATATDDKDWVSIRGDKPGWNAQGFPGYNGYGWYRTRVKVPKDFDGRKNLLLVFGAVDEDAVVHGESVRALVGQRPLQVRLWPRTVSCWPGTGLDSRRPSLPPTYRNLRRDRGWGFSGGQSVYRGKNW